MRRLRLLSLGFVCLSILLVTTNAYFPYLETNKMFFISCDDKVLDVFYGNIFNNARVITYPPKPFNTFNQIWTATPTGNGGHKLATSKDTNYFLSIASDGSSIVVHTQTTFYNQVWKLESIGINPLAFYIKTMDGTKALTKGTDSEVMLSDAQPANSNQIWMFSQMAPVPTPNYWNNCPCFPWGIPPANGNTPGKVATGRLYLIKNSFTNKVLDITAGIALNNNPLTIWPQKATTEANNQIWRVTLQSNTGNTYKIASILPGTYLLTVSSNSIVIYQDLRNDWQNNRYQEWILEVNDPIQYTYTIKMAHGGKYLEVSDGMLMLNPIRTQTWIFAEISPPDPSNCACR